ncbi:protealysin inhibitor emfourin [Microbacterium sp. ASV81]|uniref:Uncharacterized protein n=1 Tax=Microbacterium capsulatum TaxID=3041921 RepID=A0ABU0XK84_9MICO|nr:protealysin inhibitor emfourin [Microbacterium sp. ASV81]MDQ4215044.1 hypothetical protein [Microbacterium sp. ASV81]
MREPAPPADGADPHGTPPEPGGVLILVVRSGGIAGIPRRWSVQPPSGEAASWVALLERCPWDDEIGPGTGGDRFVWRIEARIHEERHEQVIPEEHLLGPWRELVDAVRNASS